MKTFYSSNFVSYVLQIGSLCLETNKRSNIYEKMNGHKANISTIQTLRMTSSTSVDNIDLVKYHTQKSLLEFFKISAKVTTSAKQYNTRLIYLSFSADNNQIIGSNLSQMAKDSRNCKVINTYQEYAISNK